MSAGGIVPTTKAEIEEFILKKLKQRQSTNDITFTVSQKYKLVWDEAQEVVHRVQNENHDQLKKHHDRGTVMFSVGFVVIGILLMLGTIYYTLTGGVLFVFLIPYFGNLIVFGTGIGFVIGGFAGIQTRKGK